MTKFSQDYLFRAFSHQGKNNNRTIFIVVGEGSKYQIPVLHERLSKVSTLGSILWLYKNSETYMDRESKKIKMTEEDNDFFKWIKTQDPEYISYKEGNRILGRTCDMLILQDFEALTPNLIACSMETVRGGGAIVLLLDTEKSIKEIINSRSDLVENVTTSDRPTPRFNRRLFKSLVQNGCAIFLDSNLKVMDITKEMLFEESIEVRKPVIVEDNILLNMCKTADQLEVLKKLMEVTGQDNPSISSITASRGRGKSVTLGLSIAHILHVYRSSVAITALYLDNVQEIFNFLINGLNSLGYKKMTEYKVSYLFEGKRRLINKIELFRDIKSTVEYVHPMTEISFHPGFLVIDEAASIPLPQLKHLLKSKKVFMASTANGYEGTGRVFMTKLKDYIIEKGCLLHELHMLVPIRYSSFDPVEKWLNKSLLLQISIENIKNCPVPSDCSLFYVSKDALFSGHSKSEEFLEQTFSLFISSHYRNSPNDMQILSDAPNHEIFVLLTPTAKVICAIHFAFEGKCMKSSSNKEGNLIPWILYENYGDEDFLASRGIRIIRIAVHPSYLSMGYGSLALSLLIKAFNSSDSEISTVSYGNTSVLLHPISKVKLPAVEWIGSSFGLTEKLLNFWKKLEFSSVCIKQTPSLTTGEFSVIVLKSLNKNCMLESIKSTFLQRFIPVLVGPFRDLTPTLVLSLIYSSDVKVNDKKIFFCDDEINRLRKFSKGIIDIRSILDILQDFSKYFFYQKDINRMSVVSQIALIIIGTQCKTVDEACTFLNVEYYKLIGILSISVANVLENYKIFN